MREFTLLICICTVVLKANCYSLKNKLDINFPKCCGKSEQLKTDLRSCVNMNEDYIGFYPDDIEFLSSKTMKPIPNINETDILVRYNSKPKCNDIEIVPFSDSVILLNNGSILIIEDKDNFTFQSDSYCMERVFIDRTRPMYRTAQSDHTFVVLLCPCLSRVCVRKCCLSDRILNIKLHNGNIQADCIDYTWRPGREDNSIDYFIIHGLPSCPMGLYLLNKGTTKSSFWISTDGTVKFDGGMIPADEYCADKSLLNGEVLDNIVACLQPPPDKDKRNPIIYASFFVFGSTFLLSTLLLHLFLPELRKSVHSCNLIMHVGSLLIGYVALTIGNFEILQAHSMSCIVLAYVIQFSFMAAFFWLNVLCIDISRTFSGVQVLRGNNLPIKDRRKFTFYSLYAWSCTSMITFTTLLLEYSPILSQQSKLKPNFGERLCWFKYPESTIAYFYGPMGVTLICNLLLFLYTAIKISIARKETSILQREGSYRHDGKGHVQEEQHRFLLYLKLFFLMGMTWTFEIVSWSIYQSNVIWYATDFINVLRGLCIFVLFCTKKNIIYLLRKKFSNQTNQPERKQNKRSVSRTSITTQSTNSLQLSQVK